MRRVEKRGNMYFVIETLDKKTFDRLRSYFRWLIWQEGWHSDQVSRDMHGEIMSHWWRNEETMHRLLDYFGV